MGKHARKHRNRIVSGAATVLLTATGAVAVATVVAAPAFAAERCYASAATCAAWGADTGPGGAVDRDEVTRRMNTWINHTSITYSETEHAPGAGGWGSYRKDCSGFVSNGLHLSDSGGGLSTVTLPSKLTVISKSSLRTGDLIGALGAGSGGQNGHVQFFLRWANSAQTQVVVAEQGGLGSQPNYPHTKTYSWPEHMDNGTVLKSYRYKNMTG